MKLLMRLGTFARGMPPVLGRPSGCKLPRQFIVQDHIVYVFQRDASTVLWLSLDIAPLSLYATLRISTT
jgi:hypothetical protein